MPSLTHEIEQLLGLPNFGECSRLASRITEGSEWSLALRMPDVSAVGYRAMPDELATAFARPPSVLLRTWRASIAKSIEVNQLAGSSVAARHSVVPARPPATSAKLDHPPKLSA